MIIERMKDIVHIERECDTLSGMQTKRENEKDLPVARQHSHANGMGKGWTQVSERMWANRIEIIQREWYSKHIQNTHTCSA